MIAERMRAYFEPMSTISWVKVERLHELTPAIELYVSLMRCECQQLSAADVRFY